MKYSIIVACYNSAATLPRLIEALNAQTFKDFEVHFCDDGSTDGTNKDFFLEAALSLALEWEFHAQRNSRSYAKNLNQGIRAAKGEYCVIINADSFPDIDYLESLNEYVQPHRCICGIRIQMDDGVAVDLDWRIKKNVIPTFEALIADRPWAHLTGNGLCVPTEAFKEHGFFDERLKVNEGEDNELIARLYFKGYVFMSVPYLRLYHHWHRSRDNELTKDSLAARLMTQYAS